MFYINITVFSTQPESIVKYLSFLVNAAKQKFPAQIYEKTGGRQYELQPTNRAIDIHLSSVYNNPKQLQEAPWSTSASSATVTRDGVFTLI
jgi:hypothetical protein